MPGTRGGNAAEQEDERYAKGLLGHMEQPLGFPQEAALTFFKGCLGEKGAGGGGCSWWPWLCGAGMSPRFP